MQAYVTGSLNMHSRHCNQSISKQKSSLSNSYFSIALSTSEKLLYLLSVIVLCIILGFIINRSVTLFEINAQMVQMESEIHQLEEANLLLANEIAKMQSPERLIEKGIQLGLSLPDELHNQQLSAFKDHTVAIATSN